MTAPELKPCPFCGGEAKHNKGGSSTFGRFWWAVWCDTCQVEMRDLEVWDQSLERLGMLHPDYPPKECFARWNTRADIAAALVAAEREAMQARLAAAEAMARTMHRMNEGWANALELGLIPEQHRTSAQILRDEAAAARAAWESAT